MPQKRQGKAPRKREVHLYVGTRKGGFIFRSDMRRATWKIDGPFFAGSEVTNLWRDPYTGKVWAAVHSAWFGPDLQVSANGGKKWQKSMSGLEFGRDRGLNLARIWRIAADREMRPDTLWCGVDPGALFRSDDGGQHWYEVTGLTQHTTRPKWMAGGGGLMVHAIEPDPWDPRRIYAGISAAGFFRSDDDGRTWRPLNKGVRADFQADKFPEVGQCLHSMALSPTKPGLIFQQNHCGMYKTRNGGEQWEDIGKGLPSTFGFPIAADKKEEQTIYVIPENGAERRYVCDAQAIVYKSKNGGAKWEKCFKGLPQKHAYMQVLRHGLSTDDHPQKTGVYFGTTNGELWYSRNEGKAWQLLQSNLPSITSVNAFTC